LIIPMKAIRFRNCIRKRISEFDGPIGSEGIEARPVRPRRLPMTTRFAMTPASFAASHAASGLRDALRLIAHVHAVHVSRRELADMEQHLLDDIGISARQALNEAGRAPWDIRPAAPQRRGGSNPGQGGNTLAVLRTTMRMAFRRWRTRQRISQLDQHALRDIGVSYAEAEREANKAFWQR
jgi:uncharacterized protein YjiS (DUF1127 family)